jgi:outer membrane cobalamin receptor
MTFREPGHAWLAYGILLGAPGLAMANPPQFDTPAVPLLSALNTFSATPAADESLGGTGAAKGSDAGVSKPAAASAGDTSLQEVIVTAQKREQRLMDVPIPVTAISAPSLATQSQFRLEDYYSQVPGLSLTPNEFGGVPTIAIRGVTSGDFTNPTVGITVDGIAFGPSTSIGGGFSAPDLDPSDLARIEILRGPQGTLYGASSMGGLVNYVTVDPSPSASTVLMPRFPARMFSR